ncbi:adenylate/guanylate cyclase domain-containing protein [Lichenibacterium dinghuense]|uniref:adenylate/guanylate cyclase domain-containing protein n=1 Tax=Lichenibacterium dinghuense TaxID=2895977 RepID=UPI001F315AA8|nr:adenylate/guanylate cyclase domain-containing protein [Lichenibacterium sp. 6Y81]
MTPNPALPPTLAELPYWIARQARGSRDGDLILDGLARSLRAAGLPLCLVGFGTTALSAVHRGVTLSWWRDAGVEMEFTAHGAPDNTPISAVLAEGRTSARWRLERGEGCDAVPRLAARRAQGCTDYLLDILPFPPGTALRGVGLFYATDRPGGFSEAEIAVLDAQRDIFSLAVLRYALSHALEDLLRAYVGPRTAARVLNGGVRRGQGELMPAAILLADLKGFTAATDREDPRRLVGWLDEHLDALGLGIAPNGGEILKFTGDGFIAVFPVEDRDASPCRVCGQALAAARAGLDGNRQLEARRRAAGEPALAADLALHYGEVVYGNIGTASRLDFTAIGRAVNEASRIETLCDATGRNLLMSDSFARRCAGELIDLGAFPLRGVAAEQRIWTVAEG